MISFYSIPEVPGMVINSTNKSLESIDLPKDSVLLYWDNQKKALFIYDGISSKVLGYYPDGQWENIDEYFFNVTGLPYLGDIYR